MLLNTLSDEETAKYCKEKRKNPRAMSAADRKDIMLKEEARRKKIEGKFCECSFSIP